jgi:hypothetical protein
LDVTRIVELMNEFVSLINFHVSGPDVLLNCAKALSGLNLVISLVRVLIARLNIFIFSVRCALLAKGDYKRTARNVEFKEVADNTYEQEEKKRAKEAYEAAKKRLAKLREQVREAEYIVNNRGKSLKNLGGVRRVQDLVQEEVERFLPDASTAADERRHDLLQLREWLHSWLDVELTNTDGIIMSDADQQGLAQRPRWKASWQKTVLSATNGIHSWLSSAPRKPRRRWVQRRRTATVYHACPRMTKRHGGAAEVTSPSGHAGLSGYKAAFPS